MLYRYNVHAGKAENQAPGSRSLSQVHTTVHCCHIGYPRNYQIRVIKLIRGSKILMTVKNEQISICFRKLPLIVIVKFMLHLLHWKNLISSLFDKLSPFTPSSEHFNSVTCNFFICNRKDKIVGEPVLRLIQGWVLFLNLNNVSINLYLFPLLHKNSIKATLI